MRDAVVQADLEAEELEGLVRAVVPAATGLVGVGSAVDECLERVERLLVHRKVEGLVVWLAPGEELGGVLQDLPARDVGHEMLLLPLSASRSARSLFGSPA